MQSRHIGIDFRVTRQLWWLAAFVSPRNLNKCSCSAPVSAMTLLMADSGQLLFALSGAKGGS